MSIIIEGCDLSGKHVLAKSLRWPLLVNPYGERGRANLKSCMKLKNGYNLLVRWWMTEYVYAIALKREPVCTFLDMWKFKMLGDVIGAVMIYLDPRKDRLTKRYQERKEKHSLELIFKVREGYNGLFISYPDFMPPIFLLKDLSEALYEHDALQCRTAGWLTFNIDGWGSLKKDNILMIGEKISPNSKAEFPFAFETNRGCGRYLFNCLGATIISPSRLHIMNLFHQDGSQGDWLGALEFLKPRMIIALGKIVSDFLTVYGIKHREVPHPQYWKRFHYADFKGYVKLLEDACYDR